MKILKLLLLVLSEGKLIYSEVRTVLHRTPDAITVYKSITTEGNKTISLSGNHLIYTRESHNEKFNPKYVTEVSVLEVTSDCKTFVNNFKMG